MSRKHESRSKIPVGLSGFMLAVLIFTAGCEPPGGGAPGGARPPGPAPVTSKPPIPPPTVAKKPAPPAPLPDDPTSSMPDDATDPEQQAPGPDESEPSTDQALDVILSPPANIEQAGNKVKLAVEILISEANPFANRLPKLTPDTIDSENMPDIPTVVQEVRDPFEHISLLGIVYHAKSPIALMAVGGAESQTQLVKTGDLLFVDGDQLKVNSIHQDGIELETLGSTPEKRSLMLPSIVTYSGRDSTGNSDGMGMGGSGASLPNLSRLGSSNPANVVLQEP